MKAIRRFCLLTVAGLSIASCDILGRDSGLFLGGADRRLSEAPPATAGSSGLEAASPSRTQDAAKGASPDGARAQPAPIGGGSTAAGTGLGTGRFVREDPPRPQAPLSPRNGTVTLNFVDADVREVVKTVLGDTLQQNFVIDPTISGMMTLQTSTPIPRNEVLSVLENALRLNGLALVRNGALFSVVPAAAAASRSGRPGIAGLGSPRGAGFGVEVISLTFASAAEIAKILQPLAPSDAILRTDTARNLLIVSGTLQERQTIAEIVSMFDVDWLQGMSFEILPLQFANAGDMIADLERVFGTAKGAPLDGIVRFFPIQRRNAVLVISARPEYVRRARSWVRKLDVGGSDQQRLYVYAVENARATDLASILGQVFSSSPTTPGLAPGTTVPGAPRTRLSTAERNDAQSPTPKRAPRDTVTAQAIGPALDAAQAAPGTVRQRSASPGAPPLGGQGQDTPVAELPEQMSARIIADDTNNSLVVMARPRVWKMIEDALRQLDVVPVQVMIEATIAEVTLNDELRYGVQSFFSSGGHSTTLSTGASAAISSTFPGFSYVFQNRGNDIKTILDALDSVTDIRVISSPQVLVVDNRTAELQVGDQVPISTQQSVSNNDPDAPTINQIELRDTGVVLRVTPRVNASGVVNLEIEQEESSAVQTTSSGIDSPTIQQRKLRSTVIVNSGETVALGGLIRDTKTDAVSGIPLLASIPILGNLFGSTSSTGRRTELLVLIKPRVIRNPDEARKVTRELRETLRNAAGLYQRPDRTTP